jgi:flagellar protein FliL
MATEAAKVEAATKEAGDVPKKKKGKLLFVIIAVLLIGGAAGAWFEFKPKSDAAEAQAPTEKTTPKTAALYYKFDPAFVVNFGGEGSARYLQVMVEAMTRDPPTLEMIKNNEPAVRNDLVLLFSSQDNATLLSPDGKEKLRNATLEVVRKIVTGEGGDAKNVENVYFTSFVIQ